MEVVVVSAVEVGKVVLHREDLRGCGGWYADGVDETI